MRGHLLLLGVVCAGALAQSACDLNALIPEEARTFTVPADSEVEIPGSQIVGQNPLAPTDLFPANFGPVLSEQIQQSFSTEGVDRDAVASMTLTTMRVVVVDPEENGRQIRDLGFLDSARFFLSANESEPRLVAFSADGAFANDPIEYDFELTEEELADLVQQADALDMTAEIEANRRPTFTTTLRFEVELTVIADVAGALN